MAYLRDIVHRLERSLHTVVRGTYDGRCKINYIRFTSEKSTENLTESRQTHQGLSTLVPGDSLTALHRTAAL